MLSANPQTGGGGERFAFARHRDEINVGIFSERMKERGGRIVGQADDMRDANLFECFQNAAGGQHGEIVTGARGNGQARYCACERCHHFDKGIIGYNRFNQDALRVICNGVNAP